VDQSLNAIAQLMDQHGSQKEAKAEVEKKIKEAEATVKELEKWFKDKGLAVPQGGSGIVQNIQAWISKKSKEGHAVRQAARLEKLAKLEARIAFLADAKKSAGGRKVINMSNDRARRIVKK
jgi:chaperonin cofactor prefoldin